jgi:hypothetical protein
MSAFLDFYLRLYGWMHSAPLSLLVLLGMILLITVPAAANAVISALLWVARVGLRITRPARTSEHMPAALRHPMAQFVSLVLLLSWAS